MISLSSTSAQDFKQADGLAHLIASQPLELEENVAIIINVEVAVMFLDNCSNLVVILESIRITAFTNRVFKQAIEYTRSGHGLEIKFFVLQFSQQSKHPDKNG